MDLFQSSVFVSIKTGHYSYNTFKNLENGGYIDCKVTKNGLCRTLPCDLLQGALKNQLPWYQQSG